MTGGAQETISLPPSIAIEKGSRRGSAGQMVMRGIRGPGETQAAEQKTAQVRQIQGVALGGRQVTKVHKVPEA